MTEYLLSGVVILLGAACLGLILATVQLIIKEGNPFSSKKEQ